jgi:hypothetical protein
MQSAPSLVQAWREASARSGWTDASEWWTPAVEAVVDALDGAHAVDIVAASALLGRQRAAAGVYLDETRADVQALAELAGFGAVQRASVVDALTLGWVDRTLDDYFVDTCIDPLTELATLPYLMTRLRELYAEADVGGTDLSASHALVVVRAENQPDRIAAETQMITLQLALRVVFSGGETLARVGANLAVSLARRSEGGFGPALSVLRSELALAEQAGRLAQTRTWVEALPADCADVPGLLRSLNG